MKNKLMRKSSLMAAVLAAAIALTACGGSASSAAKEEAKTEEAAEESEAAEETEETTEESGAAEGGAISDTVANDPKVTLKVGGIQTTEDPSTEALYRMADTVNELSGGSVTLEVYPASQLGNAASEIEAMGMGSQDMFVDANWMGTFMDDKIIDTMWFIFEDADAYKNYINSDLNHEFEEQFRQEQNIRIIASNWYRAPRSFVSKKPLETMDDFKGLVIRVPELSGYLESVDAIGGKATQVAWSETYLALSQGVVDAAEGPKDNLYSMNFYEAAPYVTITNHLRDSMQVMINSDVYDRLTEDQQEALTQAAVEAGDWYSAQVDDIVAEALKAMEEKGATVTEMDPALLDELRQACTQRIKDLDAAGTYWKTGTYDKVMAATEGK